MKIWTHRNEPPQRQCGNAIPSINKMAYHFILDMTVTVQIYLTYHFGKWKRILQIHCINGSPLYTTTFWKQLSLFCIQDYGGGNSIFWWEKEWERTLAIQAGDKELSGVALCLSKGCFKSYSKMLLKQNNHSTICTHTQACVQMTTALAVFTGDAHKEVELDLLTFRHCTHRTMLR